MGNGIGRGANRMAIAAMANATQFEKKELLDLHKAFAEVAKRQGASNTINRAELQETLELVGIVESDREILDRLFTMYDRTGDDQIDFREFVVGVAPLVTGDVADKIHFSFELFDLDKSGEIEPEDIKKVLKAMNSTASYFGDPVLSRDEIDTLVDDMVKEADVSNTGTLLYSEYIQALSEHPILVQFVTGQGKVRYGS